jgi:HPt (histidine-containing phosphotransfer) domain-containing protein
MSDASGPVDDREDGLASLRREYAEVLRQTVPAVNAALDARDHAVIRTLAHQARGASGMYGYPAISGIAGALEDAIDEGKGERLIRELAAEFIRSIQAIATQA